VEQAEVEAIMERLAAIERQLEMALTLLCNVCRPDAMRRIHPDHEDEISRVVGVNGRERGR